MSDVFCKACKDHDMCAHLGKCWISREELDVPSPDLAEITALRARLAEVEGALKPFAEAYEESRKHSTIAMRVAACREFVGTKHFHEAYAALASAGEEAGKERLIPALGDNDVSVPADELLPTRCANCGQALGHEIPILPSGGHEAEFVCSDWCREQLEQHDCPHATEANGYRTAEWYGRKLAALTERSIPTPTGEAAGVGGQINHTPVMCESCDGTGGDMYGFTGHDCPVCWGRGVVMPTPTGEAQ